jgi:hypothetical protein
MGRSGRESNTTKRGRAAATSGEERERAAGRKGESGCDVGNERRPESRERERRAGESGGRKKMMKTYGAWTWRAAQPEK